MRRRLRPGQRRRRDHRADAIAEGTVDTLFPPGEAIASCAALRANDVSVKMLWYCGGHGTCTTPAGDPTLLSQTGLRRMRRWLMGDTSVDTGAAFDWIDDGGVLRSAPDYPLAPAGTLPAAGAGSLLVLPSVSVTDGPMLIATSALGAVEAQYAPPAAEGNVVGEPTITLTYRGFADRPRPTSTARSSTRPRMASSATRSRRSPSSSTG